MIKPGYIVNICKPICYVLLFSAVTLVLYACPYGSPYKLDKEASIPVDESFLGKWSTMIENKQGIPQPVTMIIGKKNEAEYSISFTGDLNDFKNFKIVNQDTIKASAYMSIVANKQFLNIEIDGEVFICSLTYKNGMLSLMPIADGFTAKYIKSDEDLRAALLVHCKSWITPKFDERFCLKDMVKGN